MAHFIKSFIRILLISTLTACASAGGNAESSNSATSVAQTTSGHTLTDLSIAYSILEVENEDKLSIDSATYQILVTYKNKTADDITLSFPTSSFYKDYQIVDNNNAVIVNSDNVAFDSQLTVVTVRAGEILNTPLGELITKDQSVNYTVSASVHYFIGTNAFSLDISSPF